MINNIFKNIFGDIKTGEALMLPSEWAEKNRTLSSDVSVVQGKFKYDLTPYMREIVNTCYPYNTAKIIAIMAGAQVSKTEGLIINAILYLIANNPGNILFLSANDQLSKEVIETRLDSGIQSCGMQHLIRPNTIRKRNQRTGDTSNSKEYAGGRLYAGGMKSIDKLVRQRSVKYGFFDDWDAAPISDKVEGNLFSLLQKRFNTAKNEMKQYYISTPKTRPSNIEMVYDMGDKRKWHVPCPCCGDYIEILWVDDDDRDHGIIYKLDENGKLIEDSVGYKCQSCKDVFKEDKKYDINLLGKWIPTAEPDRPGIVSYYLPVLFSAPFMFGWKDFVYEWLNVYKDGNESISKKKAFYNQILGIPWQEKSEQIKENTLIKNTREYEIGTVPNKTSKEDGNGEIILLTCCCDLNGTLDDARLDYDVFAHSETGSIYSVDQGSIGTYYSHNRNKTNRTRWTYRNDSPDNVWEMFHQQIMSRDYITEDGRPIKIQITGIDTGWYTQQAYSFIELHKRSSMIIGIKGASTDKFKRITDNRPLFKQSKERKDVFLFDVDLLKDQLSEMINLKWSRDHDQPAGFMNFPVPNGGKYSAKRYFEQYEAEHKIIELNDDGDTIGWKWEKKKSTSQNHFFDVAVYNIGIRMVFAKKFCEAYKIKNATWAEFAQLIKTFITE